ncbi:MAG TPA: hypothetical protein VFT82_03465 [Candidatus Paceibacterota bacterium]|nr:hypothetical protein [Candidatus Paceibacterota bacterium]
MDPQFRTSFIPKKPITASPVRSAPVISLFSLLATVLFIVSLALSGGVFFYQRYLQTQIDSDKVSLDKAKGAFEPDIINQIVRLDTRIETGKQLLSSHLAVTPFFDFLSSITLQDVRFTDFNFSYLAPDKIVVIMKGQATGYAAVALQSDVLNAQKKLRETMISDLTLDPEGTVSFSVSTIVDPSLVSYPVLVGVPYPGSKSSVSKFAPATTTSQNANIQ